MKVGDLVKSKYSWCKHTGIVMKYNTGGWWVLWSDGEYGFTNPSDMEVISESR